MKYQVSISGQGIKTIEAANFHVMGRFVVFTNTEIIKESFVPSFVPVAAYPEESITSITSA